MPRITNDVEVSKGATGQPRNSEFDPEAEAFKKFFECWVAEQDRQLQEMLAASREGQQDEARLRGLVERVVNHYEHYYRVKARSAKRNVFAMFSPSWTSSLEDAYLWVGGWRPTMAFHLLYSMVGLQVESRLAEFLRGSTFADLGTMSADQLARVDQLQRDTVREEREVTEHQAEKQEKVADSSMVKLAQAVTEEVTEGRREDGRGERVETALQPKKEDMEGVLDEADELRLKTLRGVVEILNPVQAVNFLIAAAELHLRIHEWGKDRDNASSQDVGPSE